MLLQQPQSHSQLYYTFYNIITTALISLTIVLQCYHNSPILINNYITMLLRQPQFHLQLYYNVITTALIPITIILQYYHNSPNVIDNCNTMLLQ
jgi:hypothetical protein